MSPKKVHLQAPIRLHRARARLSEREAAIRAGVARSTLRHVEAGDPSAGVESFGSVAGALDLDLALLAYPADEPFHGEASTASLGLLLRRDGPDSWKIHLMNLVDEFRRTLDPRLLLLPPTGMPPRLLALAASTVLTLSREAGIDAPPWAAREHRLAEPWFVAGVESLKASALLESPLAFRRNNLFVLSNFLQRA